MGKNNYQRKEVRRTEEGFYICDRCGGYFEEQDMTRGRYGIIGICKTCTGKAHSEGAKNRKNKQDAMQQELQELRIEISELKRQLADKNADKLAHVTPREMLVRLKQMGYSLDGKLYYVTRKEVDWSKLE